MLLPATAFDSLVSDLGLQGRSKPVPCANVAASVQDELACISMSTWRLLCSSFLVLTCFLIGGYNVLPKKELHGSLQVLQQHG